MTPTWLDHLLVLVLVMVAPIEGYFSYRRTLARIARGEPGARLSAYRTTLAQQWIVAGAAVALWATKGRNWGSLGLAIPLGWGTAVGVGFTALALAALASQWRAVTRLSDDGMARLRRQFAGAAGLLPASDRERRYFRALAITAGVCEEVVYRGYLVWYLGLAIGTWPAVGVAGVGFGLAHLYQGGSGVLKTAVVGIIMGVLYAGTGSLIWPMILHAAIDLQGGAVGHRVMAAVQADDPGSSAEPLDRG